ncbi:MAG: hypothetical protein Q7S66_05570 [bacterium]|nr:hypothetical protein [bacterium]
MRFFLLPLGVALLLIYKTPVFAHEGMNDTPSKSAQGALACSGKTAFLPDSARGEGNILLIIENHSSHRITINGTGVFQNIPPLNPHHCLKRFIAPGKYEFSITAHQFKTYTWLKPISEWFAIGEETAALTIPDVPRSVIETIINDGDTEPYSPYLYLRKNRGPLLNLAAIYFLTLLPILFGIAFVIIVTRQTVKAKK